nr:integrase, catalytic region, zinc finger, CCHC-type, peptidase aspartic, catalytic [Tanacetum cinerariifolium]
MAIETHNWSSSAHQELPKIVRDEIFPIVNQVDTRLQNFEIQFLKEAAKFIGDFKSLANEADASLTKHKALELEIERLLKAVVSRDIMIIMQNEYVVDTSDFQTEFGRVDNTKTRRPQPRSNTKHDRIFKLSLNVRKNALKTVSLKRKLKIAKLWNNWYKKCNECKYDKILYDKAYKDMQQKIEQLQAHLGDLKGKCKDTSCVSDTQNQLSQKLENANVELEFQNTKFAKQPIGENFPKVGKTNALSKPVTSNSVSSPQEPIDVNNDKVIAPGMFRISPSTTSRNKKHVPNTVSTSSRTKPITVSLPNVITKKNVNSDLNGLSSTGLDNTKTRRPQPRSNTKNDRDVISKVVCAVCKKCLKSVNHDVCLNNYVNGKKSRGRKHKANISKNETQQKNQPEIKKPKKVGFIKRLATPKLRKPRFLLRRSPTSKMFDPAGKLVAPSNSESHVDCSNGCSKHMIGNLKLLINFVCKFMGTVRFGNDDVAAILGFGDLQWGNILITKNDREDIGKLGAKGDIGFFIGYSADSCAYRIYNRRTKKIMETMNVSFDELSAMAFEQRSSKPKL